MISKIGKEAINTFSGGMNADLDKSIIKNSQYRQKTLIKRQQPQND